MGYVEVDGKSDTAEIDNESRECRECRDALL